jgi:predicted MPP superfamily phosphohydrolase
MIRIFFFIIFVSVLILIFGVIQLVLLRQLNRVWWEKRWIRRSAWSLPIVGVVSMILVGVAQYHQLGWLSTVSALLAVVAVVLEIALMLSLPVSGAVHLVERLLSRRKRATSPDEVSDRNRRVFLKSAAAAVPIAAIATGMTGVGAAYADARIRPMTFRFSDLPPGLDGLRVLQFSDLHLGHYMTLDSLERVLAEAKTHSPDLVLVTGDLSDDLRQLPGAIEMISSLKPRLGCFASLGNHEYFRGVQEVRAIYAQSPIPLLVNEHIVLKVGDSDILLGGLDDPVRLSAVEKDFFPRCLGATLNGAPLDHFTLLMSHRPDVFPYAAEQGIQLTLAGHTHGGQIGFAERSLLESAFPHSYLWGEYEINASRLYTTCGAGHWFPFRLGCPSEVPLIELRRA